MDKANIIILLPLVPIAYIWPPLLKVSVLFPAVLLPALAGAKYKGVMIALSVLFLISSIAVLIMMPFAGIAGQTLGTRLALFDIEMAAVVFAMHAWWITRSHRVYAQTLACGVLMWDYFAITRTKTALSPLIMCLSYAGLILWLHWFAEYQPDDLMPGGSIFGNFVAAYMYLSAIVPVAIVASRTSDKTTIYLFSVLFCINTFVPAATMIVLFDLGRITPPVVGNIPIIEELAHRTEKCVVARISSRKPFDARE